MIKKMNQLVRPEDHRISSSDGESKLFIRQYGSQEPRIHFLIVHGALEYSHRHEELAFYLLKNLGQDIAVSMWDHVGHGKSGGLRAYVNSFSHYVNDMEIVQGFISKKNNSQTKTIILAHSLGALITLTGLLDTAFTLKNHIDGLIFSSPCIKPKMIFGSASVNLLHQLDFVSSKIHLPSLFSGKDLTRDPQRANDFDSDHLIPRFMTVAMAREIVEAGQRVRGLSYYLDIPSLFLVAGEDKIVDAEITSLFAKGMDKRLSQIEYYPQHYHELWNELDRVEIFGTMKKWIEKTLKENP